MMSINDWSDGVCGFVAGLSSDAVRRVPDHGDMRRDWLDGYNAAQAMDHVLKGSIAAVKAAEEWAHAPQGKVNQGQAAAAQNQETGQHPTDQWPGRTMHYGDRLTALERDIKTIFGCLDAQSARLNKHEARMDAHARRIAALEENFRTLDGQMKGHAADLRANNPRLDVHDRRLEDHSRILIEHGERLDGHHKRHLKLSNEVRMGDDLAMRLDALAQRLDGMEERAIQTIASRLKEALHG